jgi:uncharacterized SAM-dependent methyltransferase
MPLRNIVYFPGSTIGNFTHEAAHDLLEVMYQEAGHDGAMLIGVDLQKDPAIIECAYNDSAGITAEFNLNILTEYSHKYTLDGFAAMAARAGFGVEKVWTDSEQLFSVQYCTRRG